ncbi:DUF2225 domain-containing protein [Halanaerobium hydrogeniformans]|uniref:Uncharacterized protein n=1 Tax=Halanaerobium hydrogeniformans TaxID=656519 RepID=E4RMF8_HALHG|nr:DUF2225 domain-containing protein [Halanaerobium hydrogeniformans]ADQ14489.1 hypothetical protein Halsa_1051 [Halanaerobium hydrogeniformans]
MQPGPVEIIQCPYCDNKFKKSTLMSGNTIGAKFWTDGKREAPMLPDSVVVSFCEKCSEYFWVEDAKKIDQVLYDSDKYSDLEFLKDLTLEEYIYALKQIDIRSDDDTFYLLRQIWWKYNDYYRKNNEAELSQDVEKIMPDLLEKLLNVFDENDDNHLLMKGELLRELGQFEKAKVTLNKISSDEYDKVKQIIIDLAKNEVSELRELKF